MCSRSRLLLLVLSVLLHQHATYGTVHTTSSNTAFSTASSSHLNSESQSPQHHIAPVYSRLRPPVSDSQLTSTMQQEDHKYKQWLSNWLHTNNVPTHLANQYYEHHLQTPSQGSSSRNTNNGQQSGSPERLKPLHAKIPFANPHRFVRNDTATSSSRHRSNRRQRETSSHSYASQAANSVWSQPRFARTEEMKAWSRHQARASSKARTRGAVSCMGLIDETCKPCPMGGPPDMCQAIKEKCGELFCHAMCTKLTWSVAVQATGDGPTDHFQEQLQTDDVQKALVAEFVTFGCSEIMDCCDSDKMYDYVENFVYRNKYPKPVLPIQGCQHDPTEPGEADEFCEECNSAVEVSTEPLECDPNMKQPGEVALLELDPLTLADLGLADDWSRPYHRLTVGPDGELVYAPSAQSRHDPVVFNDIPKSEHNELHPRFIVTKRRRAGGSPRPTGSAPVATRSRQPTLRSEFSPSPSLAAHQSASHGEGQDKSSSRQEAAAQHGLLPLFGSRSFIQLKSNLKARANLDTARSRLRARASRTAIEVTGPFDVGVPAHKSFYERCVKLAEAVKGQLGGMQSNFQARVCGCLGCCPEQCYYPVAVNTMEQITEVEPIVIDG